MPSILAQSSLVKTRLEQAIDSKDPHEPPLSPTYWNLHTLHPVTFEPEMEAIKYMLGAASEGEKTRWPAPKKRLWLSIPIPAAWSRRESCLQVLYPCPLNVGGLISWNLTNLTNKSSGGRQWPREKRADGISLSSKYLLFKMWTVDHQCQHHLVVCEKCTILGPTLH